MKLDKINQEIEFKCLINEQTYNKLLDEFNVASKIFKQVNFYFDTLNNDLKQRKIVLRIRQKGEQFKLTKKEMISDNVIEESHVYLDKDKALDMIYNGFDASIINLPFMVQTELSLTTYRVSFPFENGKLFFDKSIYNGITDFEIEFEVSNVEDGYKQFHDFLEKRNIPYCKPNSKIIRAFNSLKKA